VASRQPAFLIQRESRRKTSQTLLPKVAIKDNTQYEMRGPISRAPVYFIIIVIINVAAPFLVLLSGRQMAAKLAVSSGSSVT
jgi:hypothetical protein